VGAKQKRGRWALLAASVGLALVLGVTGFYWRELRAWYVLGTQFEQLPGSPDGDREFRHKKTDIIFVLERSKP
jgi:hypothetical protein